MRKPFLFRIRDYVNKGGTVYMKYKSINDRVLEEFIASWQEDLEVHERDLEEWALIAAEELNIPNFKASHTWVSHFKQRNKIVFRARTKLVGRKRKAEEEAIVARADKFLAEVRPLLATPGSSEGILPKNVSTIAKIYCPINLLFK